MKKQVYILSILLLFVGSNFTLANDDGSCNPVNFDDVQDVVENYINKCSDLTAKKEAEWQNIASPKTWADLEALEAFWVAKQQAFKKHEANSDREFKQLTANLALRAEYAAIDARTFPQTCDAARYAKGTWKLDSDTNLSRVEIRSGCESAPYEIPGYFLPEPIKNCTGDSCDNWTKLQPILAEYAVASYVAHKTSQPFIAEIHQSVKEKLADWDAFASTGKAMLPLDMWATEWAIGGINNKPEDGFVAPPETQWFLFHPGIGYEINDNEPEGERTSPALYLEIGVNWWRKEDGFDLGLARLSGISIIGVVSDRIKSDEVGGGLMLTFDNVYELSINKYGGDYALMVGYNLYNLWEEQYKAEVSQWRKTLNKIAE